MKPNKKTTKDPEREKPLGPNTQKKKKVDKPWRLEYKVVDEAVVRTNSFFYQAKELNKWYTSTWDKFISIEQGLRELNKQARSYSFKQEPYYNHWRFAGKEFRLVNIETEQVIDILIKEREICQK